VLFASTSRRARITKVENPKISDPLVGDALRLLHGNVAHHWTVASLAAGTGVSRALLARRFTAPVGQPPSTDSTPTTAPLR
jgi:transcriptional regulator GlxA family with amidase domain